MMLATIDMPIATVNVQDATGVTAFVTPRITSSTRLQLVDV